MKNKLSDYLTTSREGYSWKYCSMGGATRVNIATGEDIAHLGELDQKLWTVLSCPVKGLEFDEKTLSLMDFDGDGKIRVNEVVSTAQWLTAALLDANSLLQGNDNITLSDFNIEREEGATLLAAAQQVLTELNKDSNTITMADIEAVRIVFEEKHAARQELKATLAARQGLPYGENTEAALEVFNAIKAKVEAYFMRCKFIALDDDCAAALDVSVEKVNAISGSILSTCSEEIGSYPLARPNKEAMLPVSQGINPAWQATFAKLKQLVLDVDFVDKEYISNEQWQEVVEKMTAYIDSKAKLQTEQGEQLDNEESEELKSINLMDKFLHLYRDFYKLLRNYVVFADFYTHSDKVAAVFQAGQLFIDQRCCSLCLRVTDMAKQADMAGLSGMFLLYCTCTSKVKNATMDIVAVMTDGDVNDLRVGKNAIFYDREGQDWDAVVTKVIDNPISIRQAFWSPYRKFWNWATEKINKIASDKESKAISEMTTNADTATTAVTTKIQAGEKAPTSKQQAFDIAKFCGIFAAIGMAIGVIGGFLVSFVKGLVAMGWAMPLGIFAIMLVISGPSMFIAWSKLRKRNLGPVLNANGWAVNAQVLVNVRFGSTLTSMARYPKLNFDDPFADKEVPAWKKWGIVIIVVVVVIFAWLYFSNHLGCIGLSFRG